MTKSITERAEMLAKLDSHASLSLIFEWVKTGVISKNEFMQLLRLESPHLAYGSGDGYWIRGEDRALRPDRERFNIPLLILPKD